MTKPDPYVPVILVAVLVNVKVEHLERLHAEYVFNVSGHLQAVI